MEIMFWDYFEKELSWNVSPQYSILWKKKKDFAVISFTALWSIMTDQHEPRPTQGLYIQIFLENKIVYQYSFEDSDIFLKHNYKCHLQDSIKYYLHCVYFPFQPWSRNCTALQSLTWLPISYSCECIHSLHRKHSR